MIKNANVEKSNLLDNIPIDSSEESLTGLLASSTVRIERIVSKGHTSPESGWYDQDENEWVMIVEGAGTLLFEDNEQLHLTKGDYVHIPSHIKHKVIYTDPEVTTIWLAVFYP